MKLPDSVILRWGRLLFSSFQANNCLLRAAALSYTTILSLVPLFALAFALLKGFGVPNKIAPLILEHMAIGSQELVAEILTYINNTNMKSLGAIGLATLMLTVIRLLGEIEEAFNAIWGVRETRSWPRKFSDYLSVVLSGPLLLFAAISVSTTLQSQSAVRKLMDLDYIGPVILNIFHLVPYLSIWAALVFLYLFIPNTRVRFCSALVGGVIAGTLWQVAQWAYIHLQLSASSYNAIYGTLAILPAFMVWLFVSWVIVLLGVEVVYAHQHRSLLAGGPLPPLSPRERSALSLALICAAVRSFVGSASTPTAEHLAAMAGTPPLVARKLLDELVETGILVQTSGAPPTYLPAHEPTTTSVASLLHTLDATGGGAADLTPENLAPLYAAMEQAIGDRLGGMTLAELATNGWRPGPSPEN